jgi:hypothetical protein
MDEDVFNTSIRKFLKSLGVTAQRELEKTVRQAVTERCLKGDAAREGSGVDRAAKIFP